MLSNAVFLAVLLTTPMAPEVRQDAVAQQLARMLVADSYNKLIATMGASIVASLTPLLEETGQTIDTARANQVMADIIAEVIPYEDHISITVPVLVKHFSDAEMSGLIEFYKAPLGAKLLHEMPAVMNDIVPASQALAQARQPLILQQVQKRLVPLIHKRSAIAPQPTP